MIPLRHHCHDPSHLGFRFKSHLATEFELLGRTRDWDSATQTGNPMHSMQIRGMLRGYANHAAKAGYEKKGALAVHLTEAEMYLLLSSM